MPDIIPFRSYYYQEGKDSDKLKTLVAPPYDVIGEKEKAELEKNPNNIVHVILPKTYEAAKERLEKMIEEGILSIKGDPCLYIYGIEYINPETEERIARYGIVGLLKLVEIFPAQEKVIPHEMTFHKYTEDRLKLIQQTDSNFSPIFMIYEGGGEAHKIIDKYVISQEPFLKTLDRDNFMHKIWEIRNEDDIKAIQDLIKKNRLIIADGHHRYITCLRHSRHGGCKYIMTLFIDFNDPGLIIYTTHREVSKLPIKNIKEFKEKVEEYFTIEVLEHFITLKDLMNYNKNNHVFGVYFQNKYIFLKLKESIKPEDIISGIHSNEWKNLNIPILHEILLEKCLGVKKGINFIKDVKIGLEKVKRGEINALFLLNPTTLSEIQTITHLKEIMPQKSTYFYPKPLSGLLIHRHSDQIE
ncbi:MAG: DUF1015 family protein [Promethearchaeota archaeon]